MSAGKATKASNSMRYRMAWLVATWFGCGSSPKAPGTVGALGALLPVLPLVAYGVLEWRWILVALLLPFTIAGVWAAGEYARARGKKDPQDVVVDEVLGQWLTLLFATKLSWGAIGIGFVLFRLFDIVKPPPIRRVEALRGGFGIVADDLLAGVYAGLVLYVAGCFNLY